MNLEKTHVARIGHLGVRNRALCNDLNLIWVKDFKLLGIVFDNDVGIMLENNFSNRLQGIEKLFNLYQKQHLSIIGKITVIQVPGHTKTGLSSICFTQTATQSS